MEKYSRVRKIGEGAFGRAVLVKDKVSGEQSVVKEINIARMTAKEREESRKETAVLAQLKHPNIVTYKESFEERGTLYIVMEYCAGGDLYGRINNQRGLLFTEDQVWSWFVQICLAIKHIHDRKILHRDIKSQNIFLTNDGRVQLGDFGIAKVLNSTVELARTCIGTPYYLSPEIVENKPYNNKSDIWSLGCVLYELSTLKHAFEAGNMKNLVLKIIRGSYPPIPPKYSYELRGLIAQLFKRAPRDRPSINSILKKNFIISRVRNLLTEEKMNEEFSHTLLHGQKIARKLPPPPRPGSAGPKRVTPSPRPGSAAGRYNPAAVYGAPLARKSKEGLRPDLKKKNASGGRVIPGQQEWERKKQDLIVKENKRREEIKKKEQDAFAQRHKELVDRQKMARINKAREEGWRNLVDPGSSDDRPPSAPPPAARPLPKPTPVRPDENVQQKDRGKYEQYNDYLNRIKGDPKARVYEPPPVAVPRNNAAQYMAAPQVAQPYGQNKADRDYINRALQRGPPVNPVRQIEENRRAVGQANERARVAEEFLQRKREAALNKQRGHAQMYGYTPPATPIGSRPNSARGGKPGGGGGAVNARNREEQQYLDKLRQIREQNMKERKMLQGQIANDKKANNDPNEVEARKKKMDALRKQAEEWSQKKKEQLEKDKKEIMDRMRAREEYMKQREQARGSRPVTPRQVDMKPAAAVPITGALHAIGAADSSPESPERPKSAVQKKKDDILKRLNEKGRGQWESPQTPDLAVQGEGEEDDGSETARSKWGDADKGGLANLPLEQTASQMEATSVGDKVVRGGVISPPAVTPRNQWGKPGGTVVGVLDKLPICDSTMTINSGKSDGSTSSEGIESAVSPQPVVPAVSSGVGATITISKTPVQKGTIVIKAAEDNATKVNAAKGVEADTAEKISVESEQTETTPDKETSTANETEDVLTENQNIDQSESQEQKTNESSETGENTDQSEPSKQNESNQSENLKQESSGKETNSETVCDVEVEKSEPVQEFDTLEDVEEPIDEGEIIDIFKKPRLLPKPVLTGDIFVKAPEVANSKGAGSLFDKVELEEEDEEEDEGKIEKKGGGDSGERKKLKEENLDASGDGNKFVTKGITTGQFDLNDIGLLRTASEPDLSKLCERETPATLTRHISMDLSVVQEESEDFDQSILEGPVSPKSPSSKQSKSDSDVAGSPRNKNGDSKTLSNGNIPASDDVEEGDDDNEDEDEEEDDDDDLISVRATMQSLLLDDDSANSNKIKFSMSSDAESVGKRQSVESQKSGGESEEGGNADEDQEEENADEEEEELKGLEEEDDGARISTADLFDDSDCETQFGDDDEDDDADLFSRLEQQRADLEAALGDKLIEVYKAVQAMQEDEDGNIEEGARMAMEMLGKQHEHLYPKIFQLVISDTAYTEDNA